tara:strand:+ start:115 stop:288 length:174 start_codon:yes stop_codon:yes gene_type:complete
MINFSKKETKLVYNHINKFLKQFESEPMEWNTWEKVYDLKEMRDIRDKLKLVLENNA